MIFIQDLSGLFQIYPLCFCFFPGKSCHKIQIIIEHTGFDTLFSLLPQAVENFFRFLTGSFVHTGFGNPLLELLHIRDIFRMHVVKLFLEMLHLTLDCCFFIALLILFLLGGIGFVGDPCNFHILVECLFNQFRPRCQAVLCKDCIAFFI